MVHAFTEEEARVLEEGGADLSPWGPDEEDPRVATATKHEALLAAGLSTDEAARVLGVTEDWGTEPSDAVSGS